MTYLADSLRSAPKDDLHTSEKLLPVVYEELRRLAAARLKNEAGSQTLQPTALVHEAWLRVSGIEMPQWESEGHFFGAAAQAMRRILVERARGKATLKRSLPDNPHPDGEWMENDDHIIMIHECLDRLERSDPCSAKVVLLKFYGGLSSEEIGRIMGRSVRSVERHWMFAKAKLYRMITADQSPDGDDEP